MEEEFFEDPAESPKIKMAVFAGAGEALKRKKENWKMSDEEIMQAISDRVDEIVKRID
jgi:predicted NBD/HSP70 family sugar kinase